MRSQPPPPNNPSLVKPQGWLVAFIKRLTETALSLHTFWKESIKRGRDSTVEKAIFWCSPAVLWLVRLPREQPQWNSASRVDRHSKK